MNSEYIFETKESGEAAFMWTYDHIKLIRAIPKKRNRSVSVYFVMSSDRGQDVVEALRRNYYNGEACVDPHQFVQRQADIKTLICQTLDNYRAQEGEI